VDVFEALPAPFGLVRYGVAPDHPKIQSVANQLAKILGSPGARFFGNVEYGADLTLADLSRHYHAVVLATGAPNERALGVPGENLPGAFAAAGFVAWYNGHPAAVGRDYLSARQAVVVGAGNVALDVARMLVTDATALVDTDMPQHVLDAWRSAQATDVYVLARRGPAYAKFTTPELRELNALDVVVDPADLVLDAAGEEVVAGSRAAKRNLDMLRAWADQPSRGRPRRIHPSHVLDPADRDPRHRPGGRGRDGAHGARLGRTAGIQSPPPEENMATTSSTVRTRHMRGNTWSMKRDRCGSYPVSPSSTITTW
jgi:ferredoxin--NADP+ reductase